MNCTLTCTDVYFESYFELRFELYFELYVELYLELHFELYLALYFELYLELYFELHVELYLDLYFELYFEAISQAPSVEIVYERVKLRPSPIPKTKQIIRIIKKRRPHTFSRISQAEPSIESIDSQKHGFLKNEKNISKCVCCSFSMEL